MCQSARHFKQTEYASIAQLVEHLTLNQGAARHFKQTEYASIAQLVEHLTLNQGVQGSSPCGCTTTENDVLWASFFVA